MIPSRIEPTLKIAGNVDSGEPSVLASRDRKLYPGQNGAATTLFAVGNPHTPAQPFDEAMYAPAAPLTVTTAAEAHNDATGSAVQVTTGNGVGRAHQAIRRD